MKDLRKLIIETLKISTSSIAEAEREKLATLLTKRIHGKFYLVSYRTQESFE
jgi:hypothetical protein